jgi:alkaline phosphatase
MSRSPVCFALLLIIAPSLAFSTTAGTERDPTYWARKGEEAIAEARKLDPRGPTRARNVILFVGDGMGITTVTAARILEGQRRGGGGEDNLLAFERLPRVAFSRTYSASQQTAESSATMSAMITGVKTNDDNLSVSAALAPGTPLAEAVRDATVPTLLELAEARGLSTGVVSTTRLTHATPAACYAHTSSRYWEADSDRPAGATVPDIAAQFVDRFGAGGIGDGIEVAMSGGRARFLPRELADPRIAGATGRRADGRNLIAEWQRKSGGDVVYDLAGFESIDPAKTRRLLGLFAPEDMDYEVDRSATSTGQPSLAQMTGKAIDILAQNRRGYFLMVEGGRIDHAHHAGNAHRALADTIALSDAVRTALERVDLSRTLVIVTADHSHAFVMGGYPKRGNPILGKVVERNRAEPALAADGLPYTTLGYLNGPGFHEDVGGDAVYERPVHGGRAPAIADTDTTDPDFHQEALVPLEAETHGGEDVPVYSGGPGSQLIHGVQQQSYLFYVMKAALRL